ncbi:MAG: alginate lyase family protein [Desulfomonilaceae bacterium]
MNIWKYRYRRFRSLSLSDVTRRLEIRSWRKNLVKFVNNKSTPITSKTIREWLSLRLPSIGAASIDPGQINSNLLKSIPKGFLTDQKFWKTFGEIYPKEKEQLINFSLGVTQGQIQLFGWKSVSVSIPALEFHNRNASGIIENWGSSYYWDINFYHSHEHPEFDVKWLWELQRFQSLLWLGAAWKLTADNKFASTAREILNTWMKNLRYPLGVEWSSNLEVGLRLLSISRCHIMCMDSPSWDPDFLSDLVAWEYLHAIHIREELTLHHTLGNHPLGEASALLWFALVTPSFKESSAWKDYAYKIINQIIPKLIYSDGVYVEQSTCYLKFVLEFMIPIILLNNSKDNGFSSSTLERVKSSLGFIQAVSSHGKEIPMIGDSDSGSAIGWRLSPYWDFSWLLAAGSTLLNALHLARGIDKLPAEAFLNVGLEGLNKFNSSGRRTSRHIPTSRKEQRSYVDFPVGGYRVTSDSYFRLIFDAGPLGIYPGFGHGHADALSILLNVRNKPLVIDSGTMHYNAEAEVRGYFRKTQSHNTLAVNGHGQAEILDTFKWVSDYNIQWVDTIVTDEYRVFSGLLRTCSFVHERVVIHVTEKGFIIRDRIQTDGTISIEGFFHFSPDVTVETSRNNKFLASLGNDVVEIIFPDSELISAQIIKGSTDPMLGWYSKNYGEMVPTNCLTFCSDGLHQREIITTIKRPGVSLQCPEEFMHL